MRLFLLFGQLAVVLQFPGGFGGVFVAGHVFELLAALEHQYFQTFFGQFFGSPAARYPRANDDGIVGHFFLSVYIEIRH